MRYALLTAAQFTAVRDELEARKAGWARRATRIGAKVPPHLRPADTYSDGARGWSIPFAVYPQANGRAVVAITDAAYAELPGTVQSRFTLTSPPAGFNDGVA